MGRIVWDDPCACLYRPIMMRGVSCVRRSLHVSVLSSLFTLQIGFLALLCISHSLGNM